MIFVIFIVELFVFSFFRHLAVGETAQNVIGTIFVLSNAAVLLAYVVTRVKSAYLQYFAIGVAFRLFLLFADRYGWFYVPQTGWDTEAFSAVSRSNYEQGSYFDSHTNYTHVVSTIYFVVGPIRMIAQYLNLVFGVGIMMVSLQIFEELGLDEKRKRLGMLLLAIFPHMCIFSAVLLRETPIMYFLALSTLFFIRWMKNKGSINFYLSFVCILGGVWFHAGCIFWCTGYLAAMLFFRPNFGKNTFSPTTIVGAILAVALAVVSCVFFMDGRVEGMAEGLSEGATVVDGEAAAAAAGSAYLTWLNVSNPFLLLLCSPLKMFYFLYSPIPFDWRGLMDIIAFFGDSTFYIWASWVIWKNYRKRQGLPKNIARYLGVSLVFMTFAFAFGTIASGTALRHRCKFMPELLAVTLLLAGPSRVMNGRRWQRGFRPLKRGTTTHPYPRIVCRGLRPRIDTVPHPSPPPKGREMCPLPLPFLRGGELKGPIDFSNGGPPRIPPPSAPGGQPFRRP